MYGVPDSLRMCAEVSYAGEAAIALPTAARFGRRFLRITNPSSSQSAFVICQTLLNRVAR